MKHCELTRGQWERVKACYHRKGLESEAILGKITRGCSIGCCESRTVEPSGGSCQRFTAPGNQFMPLCKMAHWKQYFMRCPQIWIPRI